MLLAPEISKQEREDKAYLNLPIHSWIYYPPFHNMHLCILSSTGSVQVWVSLGNSCQCQVRCEQENIQLYLRFGILFVFANPWSTVQLYLGIESVWYKSKKKQINVVFSHDILLLANFSDLKQTFSLSSLQRVNLLTWAILKWLCVKCYNPCEQINYPLAEKLCRPTQKGRTCLNSQSRHSCLNRGQRKKYSIPFISFCICSIIYWSFYSHYCYWDRWLLRCLLLQTLQSALLLTTVHRSLLHNSTSLLTLTDYSCLNCLLFSFVEWIICYP